MDNKKGMPEEFEDIKEIIRDELGVWGYYTSEQALDATVEKILDAYGGNIMNGYA